MGTQSKHPGSQWAGPPVIRCLVVLAIHLCCWSAATNAQTTSEIAPVKPGDRIEVKWVNQWYPGTVIDFADGFANVSYQWGPRTHDGKFALRDMRFPNNEGHWMIWSDASGKFRVEARYISRTATHVTIRKSDGSETTVPIDQLSASLRKLLAQTPITGEENKINGADPVQIGDKIQVKRSFDWEDARVIELKIKRVVVERKDSWGSHNEEYSFDDIRFPNGEGPWQEWTDASKSFTVIARYLTRDETHVTLRKRDGSTVKAEIERLSPTLRKVIAAIPIVTRRPEKIDFTASGSNRRGSAKSNIPTIAEAALSISEPKATRSLKFNQSSFGFSFSEGDSVSRAIPVGGSEQWVSIGTYGSRYYKSVTPAKMFWVSLANKAKVDGPKFLSDERILAYSAAQSRLITAIVKGHWEEPVQICSYRLEPGGDTAVPEISWPMPDQGRSSGQAKIRLELVGDDRLLWGYGTTISLLNLATHRIEYSISDLDRASFWVSPDEQYFAAFETNRSLSLYELSTGVKIASQTWEGHGASTACFSEDGRHLACATSAGIHVWNLAENKPAILLPLGGLRVATDLPMSLLRGGWIALGSQFYSIGLKLVVWRYEARSVTMAHQQMVGSELLAVGLAGNPGSSKTVLVGAASVPHKNAVELMKKVDITKLKMLEPGAKIRIEASGDAKIAQGLRAAAQRNGWIEDPSAEATLSGKAGLAAAETRTYRAITFGGRGGSSSGEETHTVQPWVQEATISLGDQRAWGTSMGGVPGFVTARGEGASLGNELAKSSQPSYALFESLQVPAEILYPKYQRGLGVTWLTPTGFIDEAN